MDLMYYSSTSKGLPSMNIVGVPYYDKGSCSHTIMYGVKVLLEASKCSFFLVAIYICFDSLIFAVSFVNLYCVNTMYSLHMQ